MTPVQAVLFDYGMVLSAPPDPAAWQRMRTITGLSEDLLHREYWAHRHDYDRGTLTGVTYWQKAAAGAGITLTPQPSSTPSSPPTPTSGRQLNHPMIDWAQRLQRAGLRTGILSNMPDAMDSRPPRPITGSKPSTTTPGPTPSSSPSPKPPSTTTPPKAFAPLPPTSSSSTTAKRTSPPPSPPACKPSSTATTPPSSTRCKPEASPTSYNSRGLPIPKSERYSMKKPSHSHNPLADPALHRRHRPIT